jgi:hypothetical protein
VIFQLETGTTEKRFLATTYVADKNKKLLQNLMAIPFATTKNYFSCSADIRI